MGSDRAIQAGVRRAAAGAIALLAFSGAMHGCKSPSAPPPPPGGGQTLSLSYAEFRSTVEPVLIRQGCDAGADCHGGGIRGNLQLSPATAIDTLFDYNQVVLEVSPFTRDSSLILRKPLALTAGGLPHSFKPFASTSDPDYMAIRQWILDGVLQ
jgi:hypothetical protein